MKPEKPSRNEDEYFAGEDAELLRKQRERELAASVEAERKTHYMKCPKDGYDLASSEYRGMWLDAGELEAVAKGDSPSLITRVLSDALSTFRRSPRGADRTTRDSGSPR